MFDIVIPVGPSDAEIIKSQIKNTLVNVIGYRNIYLICSDSSLQIENCITISENIFPFSLETVSNFHGKLDRNGWYFQQLLKLYAGLYVPNILDIYLVIDADTFFIKPTTFYQDGKCLYNYSWNDNHHPYFEHMKQMHAELTRIDINKGGICHHMMFETKYIKELFNLVESKHNDLFYNIFLKTVSELHYTKSGASEYEMYFNFMLYKHPNEIILRKLNWWDNWRSKQLLQQFDYDYISYHWYSRQ